MSDSLIQQLRSLCTVSEATQAFFDLLSQRKNEARVTKVDRVLALCPAQARPIARREIIKLLQQLEELKMGRFIMGRRSQPSRFEWAVSSLEVARAATGASGTLNLDVLASPTVPDDECSMGDVLLHQFHLRPDFCLTVELPVDLTQHEADRLAAFVRTLPIVSHTHE